MMEWCRLIVILSKRLLRSEGSGRAARTGAPSTPGFGVMGWASCRAFCDTTIARSARFRVKLQATKMMVLDAFA